MSDIVIAGTDTDAGKTAFSLLWLHAFADEYEYWKPIESGDSDTEKIRLLVPSVIVHEPCQRYQAAVAPPLAARMEGASVPSAEELARTRPATRSSQRRLLIETFGSPFSPLNETQLQVALLRRFNLPMILVGTSKIGAIGRFLQCVSALATEGMRPVAIVLFGPADEYAMQQIRLHTDIDQVFSLQFPATWSRDGIRASAEQQRPTLEQIHAAIQQQNSPPMDTAAIRDLLQTDRASIWHPFTSLRDADPPLIVTQAKDEFLWLADGRRIIDGISSWWTILHGHRFEPLMRALAAAAGRIDHVQFAGATHADAIRLAELLLSSMPWPRGRVFYSDNGSTSVEVALKLAYQFWCLQGEPKRTLFIGFEGAYHGDTFGAMSAGRNPVFFGRFEPLLFQARIVPLDPARLDDALNAHKNETAAVIVEPLLQAAGGMRMHSPQLLQSLFDAARRHKVLFIADEVMTGGGRLGPLWAHQAAGIAPDLVCAAKTLAGGVLPLAATLVAPHVVAAFDSANSECTFYHGHSFTAHPLACAVAVANWQLLTTQRMEAPQRMEAFWRDALSPVATRHGIRDVRICGTIAAVELDLPGGYLAAAGRAMRRACLEKCVMLRPLGNVLYAMPPFCTSEWSLQQIAAAMKYAIEEVLR